jgi:hypothetical protein
MSSLSKRSRSNPSLIRRIDHPNVYNVIGQPFTESIFGTNYKAVVNFRGQYEIYFGTAEKHWLIMAQLVLPDTEFQYISFEATTRRVPVSNRLIPAMRVVDASLVAEDRQTHVQPVGGRVVFVNGKQLKSVGSVNITMSELCRKAEDVRTSMGRYDVLSSNSQHFCNKLLGELGLPCAQQKPEPAQEEQLFDMCSTVFPNQELPLDGVDKEAVEEFKGY